MLLPNFRILFHIYIFVIDGIPSTSVVPLLLPYHSPALHDIGSKPFSIPNRRLRQTKVFLDVHVYLDFSPFWVGFQPQKQFLKLFLISRRYSK